MDEFFEQRVKLIIDCFHDDRDWTERFVLRNSAENRTVSLPSDDGTLAASLFLEPMELVRKGSRIPLLFINCLGTRPDLRLKGYATRLLKKTFADFRDNPLFVLLPFNVDFYLKQGFVPLNTAKREPIVGKSDLTFRNYTVSDYDFCMAAYKTCAQKFDAYAERSMSFLEWRFQSEAIIDDNALKIILKEGKAVGYLYFSEEHLIGEYAFLPPYDVSDLSVFSGDEYLKFGEGTPYMMARAGNAEKLLTLVSYNENFRGTLKFNLSDSLVSENRGGYILDVGEGKLASLTHSPEPLPNAPEISAELLTSLAVGCFENSDPNVPAELKAAFSPKNTLFFDIF